MEGIDKHLVDAAFQQSLTLICNKYNVAASDMTLTVRIFEKDRMLLQLCRQQCVQTEISTELFSTLGMISLRFVPGHIEHIFKTVHKAFMMETQLEEPSRITLTVYQSKKAQCPCIGVLQDGKPLKVMTLSDVVKAIELESEQLN